MLLDSLRTGAETMLAVDPSWAGCCNAVLGQRAYCTRLFGARARPTGAGQPNQQFGQQETVHAKRRNSPLWELLAFRSTGPCLLLTGNRDSDGVLDNVSQFQSTRQA